jgi:hypothetical protein
MTELIWDGKYKNGKKQGPACWPTLRPSCPVYSNDFPQEIHCEKINFPLTVI